MSNKENFAFWRELWEFVASIREPILSVKLVADIYKIGKNICENEEQYYFSLCWCCFDLARAVKKQLPDHLHARMILGEQNEKTKKYVKFCERLEKSLRDGN